MKTKLVMLVVLALTAGLLAGLSCNSGNGSSSNGLPVVENYAPKFGPDLPFNPQEWQTNSNYPLIGAPHAQKGGMLRMVWSEFPPTLRTDGPNSNLVQTSEIHEMVYETLLSLHPNTLEFIPQLATHWQISADKRTFRFRLNPKAKWADGSPVTADDVLASWEHLVDKGIKDPYNVILYNGSYEKPIIEDRYTIKVRTKKLNWRLFLYFAAAMKIFPAKYIRIPGKDYLKAYQWRLVMGSGPYELRPHDFKKQHSLTLTRRADYWAANERWNIGRNNFDKLKWVVVRDEEIQFEKFKKGELDFYRVNKSQRWVQECNFDQIKKGWIQKRKIFTQKPQGFSGFVFNMRRPPFNDLRVRKAFCYLFNRKKLMDKLFFNEYDYIDSYFPGRVWANPNNPKIRYDPEKAAALLAEAGWKERNDEGWLVDKNGKPLEILLEIDASPSWVRIMKVIKEDYEKAGIKINLKQIDSRTLLKKIEERNFMLHYQSWGAIIFPNPESSWGSKLADKKSNNNIPGFKNKRVDELCEEYNVTFDQQKRIEIIREIDGIIFNQHPYALGWYAPFTRILYWNKFGHPAAYFNKNSYGDYRDIKSLWWIDAQQEKALQQAMLQNSNLPVGQTIQKPWEKE